MSNPSMKSAPSKSSAKPVSKTNSKSPSAGSIEEDSDGTNPDFIYGGPFIKTEKPSPLLDTTTPINLQLQGTFKKSFAYYSLKERFPVILTKIIDYLSRESAKIRATNNATDQDIRGFIQYISKLKSELATNKKYALLTVDTLEAKRWNDWIRDAPSQYYFTNTWVFSECYVYRRLREGCEIQLDSKQNKRSAKKNCESDLFFDTDDEDISKTLNNFDPFDEQKAKSFVVALEPMCVVADKMMTILPENDKDKRKTDFISLIKICLWANKCDLALSVGEQVSLGPADQTTNNLNGAAISRILDPFQMINDFKDKVLVDDSSKAVDQIIAKAENMRKAIEAETSASAPAQPTQAVNGEKSEEPKIACPAKMTVPQSVIFDIVCDNAGYELFSDLVLAHFLVAQKIVEKVRFHVKKIPWFVSDVTPTDFKYVIEQCRTASFSKTVDQERKAEPVEGESPPETRTLNADNLHRLGDQWTQYLADGTFVVMCDEFWTSPHVYKDMKKYDSDLYRKLQFAVAILFKGDLNYRKLLGERNCNPVLGFEVALQGFHPAPILAARTVKADLICGLPKGKWEQISKIDEQWMEKGDYGVIQFCSKAEPLKTSEKPCLDYGNECTGNICPVRNDL